MGARREWQRLRFPVVQALDLGLAITDDVRSAEEPNLAGPGEHDVVLTVAVSRRQVVNSQPERPRWRVRGWNHERDRAQAAGQAGDAAKADPAPAKADAAPAKADAAPAKAEAAG